MAQTGESDKRLPNRGSRRKSDDDLVERVGLVEARMSETQGALATLIEQVQKVEKNTEAIVSLWSDLAASVKVLGLIRRAFLWCARYVALPVIIGYQLLHVAVWGKPSPGAEVVVRWLLHE